MPHEGRRGPNLQFYSAHGVGTPHPIEFAVAAYRFGHSMVRPELHAERRGDQHGDLSTRRQDFPLCTHPGFVAHATKSTDAMNGFGELAPQLPPAWGIDWSFLLRRTSEPTKGGTPHSTASYRIDASLVDPLGDLPEFAAAASRARSPRSRFEICSAGVEHATAIGPAVAQMMGAHVAERRRLVDAEKTRRRRSRPGRRAPRSSSANKQWLEGSAPLWFTSSRKRRSKHHGRHLGAVGSRIVAETLVGIDWYDHFSYLFQMPLMEPGARRARAQQPDLDMLALTKFVG